MAWYWIVAICAGALFLWLTLNALLYKQFFKRFYDIFVGLTAFVLLSVLLLILTVVGAIAMKGNPFFTQKRPGKIDKKTGKEKIFELIKFRTMTNEKDKDGNLLPDEKRLNRYGKFLRSTSLDELPSLFNIIKGDLSLIGPRPQLVRDMVFMTETERKRHLVRQGLTGLAQVNGRNALSWKQKYEFDLKYIETLSFFGDIKIFLKTFVKVFKREGITEEGMATAEDYGDYLLRNGLVSKEEYDKKQTLAKEILNGR